MQKQVLDQAALLRYVDRAQPNYSNHAFLPQVVGERLLERLDWFYQQQPRRILVSAPHQVSLLGPLQQRYPQATIDCQDLYSFTLPDHQPADLLIASLSLPYWSEIADCLSFWQSALNPGGLLLWSSWGPSTLMELRQSFIEVDAYPHVHDFMGMQDLGDQVLAQGWVDPVLDRECLSIEYASVEQLCRDLQGSGMSNAHHGRLRGLWGKQRWQAMQTAYLAQSPLPPPAIKATYEVIYGQAFKPLHALNQTYGEAVLVPLPTL